MRKLIMLFPVLFVLLSSCNSGDVLHLVQDPDHNEITLLNNSWGVAFTDAAMNNDLIDDDDYAVFVLFFETTQPLKYIHVNLQLMGSDDTIYFSVSGYREAVNVTHKNANGSYTNYDGWRYQYEFDEKVNRATVDLITSYDCAIVMAVKVTEEQNLVY